MNTNTYFEEIGVWPARRDEDANITKPHAMWPPYLLGFVLSLFCTLVAYLLAVRHLYGLTPTQIVMALLALAAVQFVVQLVFFFHLGRDISSRDRLAILSCTIVVVGILISGSVWIMSSLSQRMTPTPAEMEQYMDSQAGL